jgi:hypothetical protein
MGFLGDLLYYFLKVISLGQSEKISDYIARKWFKLEDCGCASRRLRLNNWLLPEHKKQYPI